MDIAAFNWVDYTILAIVVFSTLISFVRGFIREAISLASWVAAIWVSYKYGHDFGTRYLTMIEMGQVRSLVASMILFFGVLIIGVIVNYIVGTLVDFSGLSAIDRILGMAFGFARGILLVAVLLLVGEITQMDKNPWWKASQMLPQFSELTEWLKSFVPEQFEKLKPPEVHKGVPSAPEVPQSTPGTTALPTNTQPQPQTPASTTQSSTEKTPAITVTIPSIKLESATTPTSAAQSGN